MGQKWVVIISHFLDWPIKNLTSNLWTGSPISHSSTPTCQRPDNDDVSFSAGP